MLRRVFAQKVMNDSLSLYRSSQASDRDYLSLSDVLTPRSFPHILVVDDDPIFGRVIEKSGSQLGAEITYCRSIEDFSELGSWDYDVVVMDYDLGSVTGFELVSYIESYTKREVPVVLVSQTQQNECENWPSSIREFVHKDLGPLAVMDAVFEAHEISSIFNEMSSEEDSTK